MISRKFSEKLNSGDQKSHTRVMDRAARDESKTHASQLIRAGPGIVKSRNGSVLSRGFILKTDYYPTGQHARNTLILSVFLTFNNFL